MWVDPVNSWFHPVHYLSCTTPPAPRRIPPALPSQPLSAGRHYLYVFDPSYSILSLPPDVSLNLHLPLTPAPASAPSHHYVPDWHLLLRLHLPLPLPISLLLPLLLPLPLPLALPLTVPLPLNLPLNMLLPLPLSRSLHPHVPALTVSMPAVVWDPTLYNSCMCDFNCITSQCAVPCSAVQCSAVQCSTMQCSHQFDVLHSIQLQYCKACVDLV